MKKWLALLVMALALAGCGKQEAVEYYVTQRYIQQPTGNIDLIQYEYDENWNPLSSTITLDGKFASAVEYTYSEDSSVVTMTTTSAIYDPTIQEIHQTFDEAGNVIQAEVYYDGRLITSTQYTYDETGREIKAQSSTSAGKITVEHIYDENGDLVTFLTDSGYAVSRQEFAYDKNHRRISAEYYQNDQLTNRIDYTYEDGVQKGMYYDAAGKHLQTSFSTFDEAGNVLTEEVFDHRGTLQSCTRYAYTGTDGSTSSGIPEE